MRQRRCCCTELKEVHITNIKDSGSRREFESGAVRDCNDSKGRCDLLPMDVVADLVQADAKLNEDYNGMDVLTAVRLFLQSPHDSSDEGFIFWALHHFAKQNGWDIYTMLLEVSIHFADGCAKYGERNWEKGIPAHCYIDSALRHYFKWCRGDEDEPHNRAFCWNLLCLLWTLRHRPECNDLWEKDNGDGR